jgi:hypothetical protein
LTPLKNLKQWRLTVESPIRDILIAALSSTPRNRYAYPFGGRYYSVRSAHPRSRGSKRGEVKRLARTWADMLAKAQREAEHAYRIGADVKPTWLHANSRPWSN